MSKPAIFLDRDGVLNVYLPGDYVKSPAELELLPGVGEAVQQLNQAGYPVFIISNQQGVAKGLMTEDDLKAVDTTLVEGLGRDGGQVVRSYYCTEPSSAKSEFRKPRPGMILQAAREHYLDLAGSIFIGDTETDAAAARAAGVGRFFLVLSGKFTEPEAAEDTTLFPVPPDGTYADLAAAVNALLSDTA